MKKIFFAFLLAASICNAQVALDRRYIILSDSLAMALRFMPGPNGYAFPDTLTDIYGRNIVSAINGLQFYQYFPDSIVIIHLTDDKIHIPAPVSISSTGR